MLRFFSLAALAMVLFLVSGCPPQQQAQQPDDERVAGTEERTATVNATVTQNGLQLNPNRVEANNVTLNVRNNSNTARTVVAEGPNNVRQQTQVQPNQTGTLTLQDIQPGEYRIYVQNMQNQQNWRQTLTVEQPAAAADGDGTMTVNLQENRFEVSPSSVADNQATIRIVNRSNTAKTFVYTSGGRDLTRTLQPGQSFDFQIRETEQNRYRISMPAGGQQ
ncbi:MAG: cupredoxin domain-containing protein [Armatimonadota bacterium]